MSHWFVCSEGGFQAGATYRRGFDPGVDLDYVFIYKYKGVWWYETYTPIEGGTDDGWLAQEITGVDNLKDAKAFAEVMSRMDPVPVGG